MRQQRTCIATPSAPGHSRSLGSPPHSSSCSLDASFSDQLPMNQTISRVQWIKEDELDGDGGGARRGAGDEEKRLAWCEVEQRWLPLTGTAAG